MDPLSSVLSLVKIQSSWSGRFEWGKDWCVQFAPYVGIHSYAVLRGECWLSVDGVGPVHGKAGDCLLLPSGRPYRVGSDLALPALDIAALRLGTADGALEQSYSGKDFLGLGGQFTLSADHASMLTDVLPPLLHIHEESDKAILNWTLDRLADELEQGHPGDSLVIQQLATMLLVQALRVHLATGPESGAGWLFALADRRMRMALAAMHSDPAHRWTLEALAKHVGMSRTSFAIGFKESVGKAPLEYLTAWRMRLAADKLATTDDSISAIALSLGYDSQSSFSTAFRRVMHCSPRQYSRERVAARSLP